MIIQLSGNIYNLIFMLIYGIMKTYYKFFGSPLIGSMAERTVTMISKSLARQLASIPNECKKCKGKCWVPNDQTATQKKAKEMFGLIPNSCINNSDNSVCCPVALGLL